MIKKTLLIICTFMILVGCKSVDNIQRSESHNSATQSKIIRDSIIIDRTHDISYSANKDTVYSKETITKNYYHSDTLFIDTIIYKNSTTQKETIKEVNKYPLIPLFIIVCVLNILIFIYYVKKRKN